jgi:hypothetical protein
MPSSAMHYVSLYAEGYTMRLLSTNSTFFFYRLHDVTAVAKFKFITAVLMKIQVLNSFQAL